MDAASQLSFFAHPLHLINLLNLLNLLNLKVEAVVVPLLDRDGMDRVEPDEVAMEQSRQRVKLQVT